MWGTSYFYTAQRKRSAEACCELKDNLHFSSAQLKDLHSHIAVRAVVSKCAPLLLEGDEVPDGHHGVIRHIEVEQFHTGEGVESIELTRRSCEILSHKEAVWGKYKAHHSHLILKKGLWLILLLSLKHKTLNEDHYLILSVMTSFSLSLANRLEARSSKYVIRPLNVFKRSWERYMYAGSRSA